MIGFGMVGVNLVSILLGDMALLPVTNIADHVRFEGGFVTLAVTIKIGFVTVMLGGLTIRAALTANNGLVDGVGSAPMDFALVVTMSAMRIRVVLNGVVRLNVVGLGNSTNEATVAPLFGG